MNQSKALIVFVLTSVVLLSACQTTQRACFGEWAFKCSQQLEGTGLSIATFSDAYSVCVYIQNRRNVGPPQDQMSSAVANCYRGMLGFNEEQYTRMVDCYKPSDNRNPFTAIQLLQCTLNPQ